MRDFQTAATAARAELLRITAVADTLDISVRSVRRLSERGQLPAPIRLGSAVRWRRADLDEFLAKGGRR